MSLAKVSLSEGRPWFCSRRPKLIRTRKKADLSILWESTGRSLQTKVWCQTQWKRGWMVQGRCDLGISLTNCSFLSSAHSIHRHAEQPFSRSSQTSFLLLLYQHFDKLACWHSWTEECCHEVPLSVLLKVTAFLYCGISRWTFRVQL